MDRFLIAPCPDSKQRAGIWRVGPGLDARIEGQKDLVALANQPIIPPNEKKFYPAVESLRWPEKRLSAKYRSEAVETSKAVLEARAKEIKDRLGRKVD